MTEEERQQLHSWAKEGKLCDVVLVAGDNTRISAHRSILKLQSEYFPPDVAEVAVPEVSGATLRQLVQFVYTKKIAIVNHQMAMELFAAAQQLKLHKLLGICCAYFQANLRRDNCLEILMLAVQHNLESLRQDARRVITAFLEGGTSDTQKDVALAAFEKMSL